MWFKFEIITNQATKALFQKDKWSLCDSYPAIPVLPGQGGGVVGVLSATTESGPWLSCV